MLREVPIGLWHPAFADAVNLFSVEQSLVSRVTDGGQTMGCLPIHQAGIGHLVFSRQATAAQVIENSGISRGIRAAVIFLSSPTHIPAPTLGCEHLRAMLEGLLARMKEGR